MCAKEIQWVLLSHNALEKPCQFFSILENAILAFKTYLCHFGQSKEMHFFVFLFGKELMSPLH